MKSRLLIALLSGSVVAIAQSATLAPSATKAAVTTVKPASVAQKAPNPAPATVSPRHQKVEEMMDSFQTMERAFWQAWKDRDAKMFEQHMAPTALVIDNTGIADRATALNGIAGCDVKGFSLSDFKLTKVDDSNALLTYKAHNIDAICGKEKAPTSVFAATLFTKSGGKWLMLFHQESAAIPNTPVQ